MREVRKDKDGTIRVTTNEAELVLEKVVTRFGNSGKIGSQKSLIGRKAIVIILQEGVE